MPFIRPIHSMHVHSHPARNVSSQTCLLIFPQSTASFYNFSNIRYAQAPVGDLRFRAPSAPKGRNTTIDDGSIGRICPQANPGWEPIAAEFVPDYLEGKPFNLSAAEAKPQGMNNASPAQDPRTTEDCLFLDVVSYPFHISANSSESLFKTSTFSLNLGVMLTRTNIQLVPEQILHKAQNSSSPSP